jgi:hypothetical protein
MPTAALRASMARSADGSLRGRRTGRWPLSRLAGTRARTLAALVYAASESTPPHPHAELDLGTGLDGGLLMGDLVGFLRVCAERDQTDTCIVTG